MQVKWIEFLTKLGCVITNPSSEMQPCPLHPGVGNTLRVTHDICDPEQSTWRFTCAESHCGFSGDAVMLLARVRKLTVEEAFALFLPGQEFATVLETEFTGAQLDEYRNSKSNQLRIAEYLSSSQDALRQSLGGTKLRNKMAACGALQFGQQTLNAIPRPLGLLITDNLPPVFRELKAHAKAHCALYPYTYNGQVMHVRIQNFDEDTLPSNTAVVLRKDIGMFMEGNVTEDARELFTTTSEIACCNLYQRRADYSDKPPALVNLAGLPLPARFRHIERLTVLPCKEHKLSLAFALHLFSTPVIEGCPEKKISINVTPETRPMEAFPLHTLEQLPGKTGHVTEPLPTWIVRKIDRLLADKDIETVYKAFESNNVTPEQRKELMDKAIALNLAPETVQLLDTVGQLSNSTLRLANGREIRQTPTGLLAVCLNGEEKRLSNIAITITECVLDRNDEIKYMCKLRAGTDTPAIPAVLKATDFNNATALRTAVRRIFLKNRHSVYPAFYELTHYEWPDILAKLSEGKNVQQEIETLGVHSGLIHFPHFTLDTHQKRITAQQQVFTLDQDILQMYSGLRADPTVLDSATNMRKLIVAAETNPYIAGFLVGLCHIVYNVVSSLLRSVSRVRDVPQHLFYVEPEPGTWTPIYLQLCQLFADTDEVPRMPSVRLSQYLPKLPQLGVLPCMQVLPHVPCNRLKQIVGDLEVNLISVVDSDVAISLTGDSRISFVDSPDYTSRQTYSLNMEDLAALQASLPGILLDLTTATLSSDEQLQFRNAEVPALPSYRLLCRILGIPTSSKIEELVKHYYATNGISCIYAFMRTLGMLLEQKDCPIQVVNGFPTTEELGRTSPPEIFVMQDCICVGRHLVRLVNALNKRTGLFNVLSLNVDFERYQHVLPAKGFQIDENRYWVLDRRLWDKYIVGEPISLKLLTNNNVITLPKLIAS